MSEVLLPVFFWNVYGSKCNLQVFNPCWAHPCVGQKVVWLHLSACIVQASYSLDCHLPGGVCCVCCSAQVGVACGA